MSIITKKNNISKFIDRIPPLRWTNIFTGKNWFNGPRISNRSANDMVIGISANSFFGHWQDFPFRGINCPPAIFIIIGMGQRWPVINFLKFW